MSKTAFLLGASGSVGRRLIELLSTSKDFSRVVLMGRRTLDLPDLPAHIEQRVINFDEIEKHGNDFKGFDVGFCTMGAPSTVSKEDYYKIDHDYIVNSAKLAKEGGTSQFIMVSAMGADATSRMYHVRVKGETERDVTALGFDKLVIVRPGFMDGPREKAMRFGAISKAFVTALRCVSNSLAMTTTECAKSLLEGFKLPLTGVTSWSNSEVIAKAKDFDKRSQ